jgi:hypothetical protein
MALDEHQPKQDRVRLIHTGNRIIRPFEAPKFAFRQANLKPISQGDSGADAGPTPVADTVPASQNKNPGLSGEYVTLSHCW